MIAMKELEKLRGNLDRVDRRLVEILDERLRAVAEIARLKAEGLPFLRDHERESELLSRVEGWARELGIDEFRTQEIFRELIAMSLKAQEEALLKRDRAQQSVSSAHRVAFQGVEGSYSHIAARKYFAAQASRIEFIGCPTFASALEEAETGGTGYAFLPIENTTAGSINETYDLLRRTELQIVGEEILQVRHCLAAHAGVEIDALKKIFSHPQALQQCSVFLRSLDRVEAIAFEDTAAAAHAVREAGDLAQAAIASEEAAELAGLEVIARDIADQPENWTRFVVISAIEMELDHRIPAKTSLVFTTRHRHGALARCLDILAEHDLNLSKLESRPVPRRPWEYLFYVDFEGGAAAEAAALAVAKLRRDCPYLKVLGSYPARTTAAGAVDRM
jgi:chorismate mutase/prephenate dehydratase